MNFTNDIKILIAEDIFEIRSIILCMLHEEGFTNVTEVSNGAEAWSKINCSFNSGEPFELIISDWNMPELCGLGLLQKIRGLSTFKTLPFLLMTADSSETLKEHALSCGIHSILYKPFTSLDLIFNIKSICSSHKVMSIVCSH